nr:hypothetical protein [Pseudonocardia sp. AL041005-10]
MTDPQSTPGAVAAVAGAARLLSRRAGSEVELFEPEDLGGSGRSVVARARMAKNPFSDRRSVVVKHYAPPEDGTDLASDPFRYEVASCQLFTALPSDVRPSPVIIAHDPVQRLLVLEDLGRSLTLADKLFGPDAQAARTCLLGWARGLGRMQAATAGREGDFGALLRRLGEKARRDPVADQARAALAGLPELLAGILGIEVPEMALFEAQGGVRLLGGTGFRAFSPSDTCPDNNLVTSRGCGSSTSSGAASATSSSTPPTCGCRSPAARRASPCPTPSPTRCSTPGGPRSRRCGPSWTTPSCWSRASPTPMCCGCGGRPGSCCRGCPSATARSAPTPAGPADLHGAAALLAGSRRHRGGDRPARHGRAGRGRGDRARHPFPGRVVDAAAVPAFRGGEW